VKVYYCLKCSEDTIGQPPFVWKFTLEDSRSIPRGIGRAAKKSILRKLYPPTALSQTGKSGCRPMMKREAHAV